MTLLFAFDRQHEGDRDLVRTSAPVTVLTSAANAAQAGAPPKGD
jgi:hypothetical protein